MTLKLFSDLIDTLAKVANGLKAIVNLPKAERDKYRQTLDDTYRLIDTTLNMVIIRLGDILLSDNDDDLVREVTKLDNYGEWMQAEREFRLCRSLRVALRETETLFGKLTGIVSARDWDALLQQMRSILATEGEVALFVGQHFNALAEAARTSSQAPGGLRQQVADLRQALIQERQQLIRHEIDLYTVV